MPHPFTVADDGRLQEISVIQSFLASREKEISDKIAQKGKAFKTAVDNSLPGFPRRARKRLVDFLGQFGDVVLEAHGSSENATAKRKKDWQDTIATIISKDLDAMLPIMSALYEGVRRKKPAELIARNAEEHNHISNLVQNLIKAQLIASSDPTETGFHVEFDESVLNPSKSDKESKKKKHLVSLRLGGEGFSVFGGEDHPGFFNGT